MFKLRCWLLFWTLASGQLTASAQSKGEQPAPPTVFDTYCNARFDYCLEYPGRLMHRLPESQNGDGCTFEDKAGREVLRVFGRNNIDGLTLEQAYAKELQGEHLSAEERDRVITYQKIGQDYFVISGHHQGRIFYEKVILKGDAFAYATLQYESSDKRVYDILATRIFKWFK